MKIGPDLLKPTQIQRSRKWRSDAGGPGCVLFDRVPTLIPPEALQGLACCGEKLSKRCLCRQKTNLIKRCGNLFALTFAAARGRDQHGKIIDREVAECLVQSVRDFSARHLFEQGMTAFQRGEKMKQRRETGRALQFHPDLKKRGLENERSDLSRRS